MSFRRVSEQRWPKRALHACASLNISARRISFALHIKSSALQQYRSAHMVAATQADAKTVAVLRQKLTRPNTTLSQKYRILFSLRNIAGPDAEEAMLQGTTNKCQTAALHSRTK